MGKNNENNNATANIADNDLLIDFWGNDVFLKVYQALSIGKIKFSFASKSKPKDGIDCYLDADIFHSDLVDIINSGEFRKKEALERQRADAEQKANPQKKVYCRDIWKSPAGVNTENKVRQFSIQPGSKSDFVIRATMGDKSVMVPVEWYRLKLMVERWRHLVPDYDKMMRERYNLSAMENEYHAKQQKKAIAELEAEEREAQANVSTSAKNTNAGAPQASHTTAESQNTSAKNTQAPIAENKPDTSNVTQYRVKVTTPLTPMGTDKLAMKAVSENNTEYAFVFDKEQQEKAAWTNFSARCQKAGAVVQIRGIEGEKYVTVKQYA